MTTKLLQHVEAMQDRMRTYIQPGVAYVEVDGKQHDVDSLSSNEGFINDMIYLLDGPEQREAQFDYMAESARTASGHFHGDLVYMSHLEDAFAAFTAAAREIDRIKKLLFYGEDPKKDRYRLLPQHPEDRTMFEALGIMTYAARSSDNECLAMDGPAAQRAAFILHAILGVASEAGEQVEAIETTMATGKFDAINLMEESGDTKWYLAMLLRALGFAWDEDERRNIAKLRDRYPEKFTTQLANDRNLSAERATLEGQRDMFEPHPDQTSPMTVGREAFEDEPTFDAEQVAAAQDMDASAPGYDPLASRRAVKDAERVKTQFEGLPVADTREGIGAQPVGTHGDPASPLGSRGYGE